MGWGWSSNSRRKVWSRSETDDLRGISPVTRYGGGGSACGTSSTSKSAREQEHSPYVQLNGEFIPTQSARAFSLFDPAQDQAMSYRYGIVKLVNHLALYGIFGT